MQYLLGRYIKIWVVVNAITAQIAAIIKNSEAELASPVKIFPVPGIISRRLNAYIMTVKNDIMLDASMLTTILSLFFEIFPSVSGKVFRNLFHVLTVLKAEKILE